MTRSSIAALFLASSQAPLASTMISVGLPSLSRDLAVPLPAATHWLVGSYMIVNLVGQSPGGRVADVLGPLVALRIGMCLQALGALVALVSSQLGWLVAARSCTAAGGALVIPASLALLRVRTPEATRGRMFGWQSASISLAAALGPPLGGELLQRFGWRSLFVAQLTLFVVSAIGLVLDAPPRDPPRPTEQPRRFDGVGVLLMAAALVPLLFGDRSQLGWMLGAFGVGAVGFVAWERRCRDPLFDASLLRLPGLAAGTVVSALSSVTFYGLLFQLPSYLEHARGQSPSAVGRALFTMMASVFVSSPLGGRLCDRWGPRRSGQLALLPLLFGLAWLQRIASWHQAQDAVLALAALGFGFGLLNAPCQTATLHAVPSSRAGSAAGVSITLRYFGGILGIFMLRALLDGQRGEPAVAAHVAVVRGFLLSGLALAAVVCVLPLRTRPRAA
ncbi:MAG: MFS transporter [Polyangiales bacterium]